MSMQDSEVILNDRNNEQSANKNQKNFLNGIHNAQSILNSLESSLQKTKKYERKLMKCRASHSHLHDSDGWLESDVPTEKFKCSKTATINSPRSALVGTWSTMSMVCLQYQYEDLSRRYASLLETNNELRSSISTREAALHRLRQRVCSTRSRLAHTHQTLLAIGERYLALRKRKLLQKNEYEEKIRYLKRMVEEAVLEKADCGQR